MIIIINILAPYEAIQSFWEKKLKTWENENIFKKGSVMKVMNENEHGWSTKNWW